MSTPPSTTPPHATPSTQAPVSTLGPPVLPLWLSPYVAAVTIIAGAALLELDQGTVWFKICRITVAVGAAYGVVSPGWRR